MNIKKSNSAPLYSKKTTIKIGLVTSLLASIQSNVIASVALPAPIPPISDPAPSPNYRWSFSMGNSSRECRNLIYKGFKKF